MLDRRDPNFGPHAETSFSTISYAVSTSTPTVTNTSSGSTFSPSASPPLILAFLAIGLFTAAMVAVFGCRRIRITHHVAARARSVQARHSFGTRPEFEERPRLWDLWTVPRTVELDGGWENIMVCTIIPKFIIRLPLTWRRSPYDIKPFSANTTSTTVAPAPVETHPAAGWTRRWHGPVGGTLQRGFDSVVWRFRRPKPDSDETTEGASPARRRLQVSVPIMMPSQHHHQQKQDTTDHPAAKEKDTQSTDERLVYSIGLFEIPWHHDDW